MTQYHIIPGRFIAVTLRVYGSFLCELIAYHKRRRRIRTV